MASRWLGITELAIFARSPPVVLAGLVSVSVMVGRGGRGQTHVGRTACTAPEDRLLLTAFHHQALPMTALSSPGEKSMGLVPVCMAGRPLLASGCGLLGLRPT